MSDSPPGHSQLPSPLAIAGTLAGAGLLAYAWKRRGVVGVLAGATGAGLLATSLAAPAEELVRRAGESRRSVHVRTTLHFTDPVREVFGFFRNFEHFPRLARGLESVVDHFDGRSDWAVRTPGGERLAWSALVTKYVPSQVIGWESVPDAPVESAGLIHFYPEDGGTRVEFEFHYRPRETQVGDAVRALTQRASSVQMRRTLAQAPEHVHSWAAAQSAIAESADSADSAE